MAAVRRRLVAGVVAGAGAWLVGLLLTLVVVRALGGVSLPADGGTVDVGDNGVAVLGLVFFAAHLVGARPVPPLTDGFNLVTELADVADPAYVLLFAVPPLTLAVAGAVLSRRADSPLAGTLPVLGYLPLSAVGAVVFRVQIDTDLLSVGLQAPLLTAVVVAGTAYPLVFGLVGAAVAHGVRRRGGDVPDRFDRP